MIDIQKHKKMFILTENWNAAFVFKNSWTDSSRFQSNQKSLPCLKKMFGKIFSEKPLQTTQYKCVMFAHGIFDALNTAVVVKWREFFTHDTWNHFTVYINDRFAARSLRKTTSLDTQSIINSSEFKIVFLNAGEL